MTARTCPDWPQLMELDPDLQFKHYTVAEAHLPAEALSRISRLVRRDSVRERLAAAGSPEEFLDLLSEAEST